MSQLHRYGLRGPVMAVKSESVRPGGLFVNEYVFSRDGNLISSRERRPDGPERATLYDRDLVNIMREVSENGTITETQSLAGLSAWSSNALNGWAFGTWGASIARTTVSAAGSPLGTLLIDARDNVVSRIDYRCDANEKVLDAVQSSGGDMPALGTMLIAAAGAVGATVEGPIEILNAGAEQMRSRVYIR